MTHVLIVTSPYYADISDELVKGATAYLEQYGMEYEIINVPGAFEIPGAIRMALGADKFDGFIALGCVIRGETSHYDYVCGESARGLQQLATEHAVPIGYGILTVENKEQAWVRAAIDQKNKGRDAAEACVQMMQLKQKWNR